MRAFLLLAVLALLFGASSAQYTVCQNYSGKGNSNSTTQIALLTTIVTTAALGNNGTIFYNPLSGSNATIQGLFSPAGPLYAIFSGQQQYRVGAPNYTNLSNPANPLPSLVSHLVGYFGALFGCNATGFTPVNYANMYLVHANMSINSTQENYFNGQLALTLLYLGVDPSVVANVAAPALALFNKCAAPIAAINATAPVQICGTPDCPYATGATASTCAQYYGYYPGSSSSSSTGGSVPVTPSTYPTGSVVIPITVTFTGPVSATAGAMAVRSDIALNIASEANATAPNGNYTQANIMPYIVVYQFNQTMLAPASRRLLQTNTTSVPVRFIILGNLTNATGLPVSTASSNLITAIAAGSLVTPSLSANGGTIPNQTTAASTPGSLPLSSSSAATGAYSSGATGYYYSSSTGNGAAGKYAAGGLFVAAAAIVASLLL